MTKVETKTYNKRVPGKDKAFKAKAAPLSRSESKKKSKELRKHRRSLKKNHEIAEKINRIYGVKIGDLPVKDRHNRVEELISDMKGKMHELALRSDTSRTIQLALKNGSPEHVQLIVNDLKGHFCEVSKGRISHFVALKAILYGNTKHRQSIFHEFRGLLRQLSLNSFATQVIDQLYMQLPRTERYHLLRELIDSEYAVYAKTMNSVSSLVGGKQPIIEIPEDPDNLIKNLLDNAGPRRQFILESIESYLNRSIEKELLMFRYVHTILYQYLKYMSIESQNCRDIISGICKYFPALHHTNDGALAASYAFKYATVKDRKAAIKSIKDRAVEFAIHDKAYIIILTILYVNDDTVATRKIVQEFLKDAPYGTEPYLTQMIQSVGGSKVLRFFTTPITTGNFSPSDFEILQDAFAPHYIVNKKSVEEKEEKEDVEETPEAKEQNKEKLDREERNAIEEEKEEKESQRRAANRESDQLLANTLTAQDLKLVRTFKKDLSVKIKELSPLIIVPVIENFLLSQLEAAGQKGQQTSSTSNIELETSKPTPMEDEEDASEDMGEDMEDSEDEDKPILKKPVSNKPFGYLESLLISPTSSSVVISYLAAASKIIKEHSSTEAQTRFKDLPKLVSDIFQGIQVLSQAGEEEKDILVCNYSAHLVLKRILTQLEGDLQKEFAQLLWSTITNRLNVILASNRGCFVVQSIFEVLSSSQMKKALKPVLTAQKKTGASSPGFNLLYKTIIA